MYFWNQEKAEKDDVQQITNYKNISDKQLEFIQKNILEKGKNLLILGNQSSGKTQTLKKIRNLIKSNKKEHFLVIDNYNEMKLNPADNTLVTYKEDTDYKRKINNKDFLFLLERLLLKQDTRYIFFDDYYGESFERLILSEKQLVLTVPMKNPEQTLRMLFSGELYNEHIELKKEQVELIQSHLEYVLILGERPKIEKIITEDEIIAFKPVSLK